MSVARGALNDLSRYTVMNKKRKCARDEVLHLMNKKTRVKSTQQKPEWKHRFVCLAYHQHYQAPSSEDEKDKLHMAGLGEKVIEFPVLNVDAESFRETLYHSFPKLRLSGGFVMCKAKPNSAQLEPLSNLTYSSPAVLKERSGCCKTYLVPLQQDLDMSCMKSGSTSVSGLFFITN